MVGQSATAFWQWLLTIWLMRVFGPEELGRYTFMLAAVSPLLLFSNFQLRNRIAAQPELLSRVPEYIRLRLFTSVFCVLVAGVWVYFKEPDSAILFIVGVMLFKMVESFSELTHGVLQAEGKLPLVGVSLVVKCLLAFFLMGLAFYIKWSVGFFFSILAIFHLLVIFICEWRFSTTLVQNLKPSQPLWQTFTTDPYLYSLGVVALLTSLNASWPRFILQSKEHLSVLGHFSALFAVYAALGVILNAWLQGMLTRLSQVAPSRKARDLFLSKLAVQITIYHVVAALVLIPFGSTILEWVFGRSLMWGMPEMTLLITLSFAAGMSTLMYYFLLAAGHMGSQWVVMIFSNVLTFLTGSWLIPQSPILGAIVALLAGTTWQLACYGVMTHQVMVGFDHD